MWSIWNFSCHFFDGCCICLCLTWSNGIPVLKMAVLTIVLDWLRPFVSYKLLPNRVAYTRVGFHFLNYQHILNMFPWDFTKIAFIGFWVFWNASISHLKIVTGCTFSWQIWLFGVRLVTVHVLEKTTARVAWLISRDFLPGCRKSVGHGDWGRVDENAQWQQPGAVREGGHRMPGLLVSQEIYKHEVLALHSFFFS